MRGVYIYFEMRKAEFARTWRIAEEMQATDVKPLITGQAAPVVKLKPTLPTFSGSRSDFHR